MDVCDGQGDSDGDHCCWVEGEPCQHLVVDGPTGRRFACGLRTELGSWALVHADPRYLAHPKPEWVRLGTVGDCGEWEGYEGRPQCCFARETAVTLDGNV